MIMFILIIEVNAATRVQHMNRNIALAKC